MHTISLGNVYEFAWAIENDTIYIQVTVEAIGWIGLGFSPNGDMLNSDIVMGWIDNSGRSILSVSYC